MRIVCISLCFSLFLVLIFYLDLKSEGIFRLSGSTREVSKIAKRSVSPDLCPFLSLGSVLVFHTKFVCLVNLDYKEELHTVTGAFKQYLRELQNTVVPFELFDEAMKVAGTSSFLK